MIADILIAAVAEIRRVQAAEDQYIHAQWQAGVKIFPDSVSRANVDHVVDEMERLARRLLTDSVGPFVELLR